MCERIKVMKLKLKKGISIDGKLTKSVDLDIESITGAQCIEVTEELALRGHTAANQVMEMDKMYHAAIAAKALKVSLDDILNLNLSDFSLITMSVQGFFFEADME